MTKCTLSIPDLGRWIENKETKHFDPIWRKFKRVSDVDESYINLIESLNSDLVAPVGPESLGILTMSYYMSKRGYPYKHLYYIFFENPPATCIQNTIRLELFYYFQGLPLFKNLTKIEVGPNSSDLEEVGFNTKAVWDYVESDNFLKELKTSALYKLFTTGESIVDLPGLNNIDYWGRLIKHIIEEGHEFKKI